MTKKKNTDEYLYRRWKSENMKQAYEESRGVLRNITSLAKKHKVPVSTLKDR